MRKHVPSVPSAAVRPSEQHLLKNISALLSQRPGSVFDAEVLAHMFGDHAEEEPDAPTSVVQGCIVDRFLQ